MTGASKRQCMLPASVLRYLHPNQAVGSERTETWFMAQLVCGQGEEGETDVNACILGYNSGAVTVEHYKLRSNEERQEPAETWIRYFPAGEIGEDPMTKKEGMSRRQF